MESEYATLSDLLLRQGFAHQSILSQVHAEILAALSKSYPRISTNASVVVDELTGNVRIYQEREDVTPKAFEETARMIARQTLLSLLKNGAPPTREVTKQADKPASFTFFSGMKRKSIEAVFWIYNVIYTMYAGMLAMGLIDSVFRQNVQKFLSSLGASSLVFGGALLLTPPFSIFYALLNGRYKDSQKIIKYFFALELPILLISFVALTMFPGMTWSYLFFATTLLIVPIFLFIDTANKKDGKIEQYLYFGIVFLLFVSFSYLLVLYLFFLPPILGGIFQMIIQILRDSITNLIPVSSYSRSDIMLPNTYNYYSRPSLLTQIFQWLISIAFVALPAIGMIALIAIPFGLFYVLSRKVTHSFQSLQERVGERYSWTAAGIVLAGFFVILLLTSFPGGSDTADHFGRYTQATTYAEQQKEVAYLLPKKEAIAAEIKNLSNGNGYFLYPDSTLLRDVYQSALPALPDLLTENLNALFLMIAKPFIYHGLVYDNGKTVQTYYEMFGEYPDSVRTTSYSNTQTPSNVMLISRAIDAKSIQDGLFAEVSVTDEFASKSFSQEEVVYEFSLPQSAVVTGLALGPELEFPGVFAPRGASRKTYEQQIVKRRDPAILEQIGPRQYRLRVYPIPAQNDMNTLRGRNQKVRFTYLTPLHNQSYDLPVFSAKRNLMDSQSTSFQIRLDNNLLASKLMDVAIPATSFGANNAVNCQKKIQSFGDGEYRIRLETNPSALCTTNGPVSIAGKRIAVLLDMSNGLEPLKTDEIVKKIVDTHSQLLTSNQVDILRFSKYVDTPIKLTPAGIPPEQLVHFGAGDLMQVLAQVPASYDAVVVYVNADTAKTLAAFKGNLPAIPLFVIYDHQAVPSFDDQLTLTMIRNNGGLVDSFDEVIETLSYPKEENSWIAVHPEFMLTLTNSSGQNTVFPFDIRNGFPPNAVKFLESLPREIRSYVMSGIVRSAIRKNIGNTWTDIGLLDVLEVETEKAQLVTPFTAVLSLVNEQQLQQLQTQTLNGDRYTAGENIVQPPTRIIQPIMMNDSRVNPFGSITTPALDMFGTSMMSTEFKIGSSGGGGGGINSPVMMNYSPTGSGLGGSFSSGGTFGLLLLPTIFLFVLGALYYVIEEVKKLRKKK